ncbi:hypothetical protein B0H21DRAFT_425803 [Amylocystis lapponica]|nr:hypothetical protein B0H21DRAFT_425803 [Amylocystis lapponica]
MDSGSSSKIALRLLPTQISGSRYVHINLLPFEVLVIIFEMVRPMPRHIGPSADHGILDYFDDDFFTPTAFPKGLMHVCSLWTEILSRVPLFWTHLAISVGYQPTPPSVILRFLTLSANHPIQIVISCRSQKACCPDDRDLIEGAHVSVAMRLLLPHIARWRVFRVLVMHFHSVPLPDVDIYGVAEKLTEMSLVSIHRDTTRPIEDSGGQFSAPNLSELDLSGYVFRDSYLFRPEALPSSITELTISRYTLRGQSTPFSVHKLVACLHHLHQLERLTLLNLALDCFPHQAIDIPESPHIPDAISFVGISAPVLCEFYRAYGYFGPPYVVFTRCAVPAILPLNWSGVLSLTDMDIAEDLRPLLAQWDTPINTHLFVDNCPRFAGTLLDEISGLDGARLCPYLNTLVLKNCPHLTSAVLRRFVEARSAAAADSDQPNLTVSAIKAIYVLSRIELTLEDEEWFSAHVGYMRWNCWIGGTDPN